MQRMFEIDVGYPAAVDRKTFELWLRGCSVDRAVTIRLRRLRDGRDADVVRDLAAQEVEGHFRVFELLENYLCQPVLLSQQIMCPLSVEMQHYMVNRYVRVFERSSLMQGGGWGGVAATEACRRLHK